MAGKDFYFKSLKFINYRGLKSLSIDKLKRINLIGGFNGTGKTTLLEGLFYALDRRSPAAIARPHAMRNIGFSGIAGISSWFYGQNTENPMVMDFLTASGELSISFKFGKRSANPQSSMHGKLSPIFHDGSGVFAGLPSPYMATRYHSLVALEATLPEFLVPVARTDQDELMGVRHTSRPLFGVQFHPESVLSEHGHALLRNFLEVGG